MQIFRYPLIVADEQAVSLPAGAKVLSARWWKDSFCLWAMVDPKAPMEKRRIRIAGTGHELGDVTNLRFVDTILLEDKGLVFHVHEVVE